MVSIYFILALFLLGILVSMTIYILFEKYFSNNKIGNIEITQDVNLTRSKQRKQIFIILSTILLIIIIISSFYFF